nr:hypothetical protein [Eubacterium sp.]
MKRYFKTSKQKVAAAMCLCMVGSLTACGSTETSLESPDTTMMAKNEADETQEVDDIENILSDSIKLSSDAYSDKDETVYVMAEPDGDVKDVIVSEWLKNPEGKNELTDVSHLTDIENVKGDETFSQNGNKLTWQANGQDIYYQGKTDEEVPVSV